MRQSSQQVRRSGFRKSCEGSLDIARAICIQDTQLKSETAAFTARVSASISRLFGFANRAIAVAFGTNSRRRSTRFSATSADNIVTPVRFPSGLFRLSTSPTSTGFVPTPKTIGIAVVADLAANASGVPPMVTITSTLRRTRSAASSGNRSNCPSAHLYSMLTFLPSTKPFSANNLQQSWRFDWEPPKAVLRDVWTIV